MVEDETAAAVKPDDVPPKERGTVVVTVDWMTVDAPEVTPGRVVMVVVVVGVPAAGRDVVSVDPFPAAGRRVPAAASGKRDAAEPLVDGIKGCTATDSGAEAPAKGNGLKILVPVGGVGGAFPTIGDGLKVVGEVANGAAAPSKGNGLNALPPVVAFPWDKIDVVVTVTASA